MIPSWWMPEGWANAFGPTMALFLWTGSPMRADTILLVFMISFMLIPVRRFPKISFRVWIARTTSSRAAFPSPSPIPFTLRPCFHDRLDGPAQEVEVRPRGVLGGELHVGTEGAGILDRVHAPLENLFPIGTELLLDVDVRRAEERVDPRALGALDGLPQGVDVLLDRPRKPGHNGSLDFPGDRLDGLEIPRGGGGETRLDDVHPQRRELPGDLHLLLLRQFRPRHLFPVPQCRVEDEYPFRHLFLLWVFLSGGRPFPSLGSPASNKKAAG